jgi:hypothetical protein
VVMVGATSIPMILSWFNLRAFQVAAHELEIANEVIHRKMSDWRTIKETRKYVSPI